MECRNSIKFYYSGGSNKMLELFNDGGPFMWPILICFILGIAVFRRWDFRVDTCGIMEIEYQPEFENWKLIRFNHLC